MENKTQIVHCKNCKHAHLTTDGLYAKYCSMFTDDEGFLIEMYFEAEYFYCGYGQPVVQEVPDEQ